MIKVTIAYILDFLGATLNIFLLLILVLFLPWLFLWYIHIQDHTELINNSDDFKLGIEMISDEFLKNLTPAKDLSYAVGLVTNQTSVDQKVQKL